EIKQLATQPRQIKKPEIVFSSRAKMAFEKYMTEWAKKREVQKIFQGKFKSLKTEPPCIKAMHNKVFKETVDERNNSGTALASFYMQQGIDKEEALERLYKWGTDNCEPKLERGQINVIIDSVYFGEYRYGCESFQRLSGVCEKNICPLFHKEFNVEEKSEEVGVKRSEERRVGKEREDR